MNWGASSFMKTYNSIVNFKYTTTSTFQKHSHLKRQKNKTDEPQKSIVLRRNQDNIFFLFGLGFHT